MTAYTTILAHAEGLDRDDLWLVIPMAIISVAATVVLARPKVPPPPPADQTRSPVRSAGKGD